jgi:hypothetical protein
MLLLSVLLLALSNGVATCSEGQLPLPTRLTPASEQALQPAWTRKLPIGDYLGVRMSPQHSLIAGSKEIVLLRNGDGTTVWSKQLPDVEYVRWPLIRLELSEDSVFLATSPAWDKTSIEVIDLASGKTAREVTVEGEVDHRVQRYRGGFRFALVDTEGKARVHVIGLDAPLAEVTATPESEDAEGDLESFGRTVFLMRQESRPVQVTFDHIFGPPDMSWVVEPLVLTRHSFYLRDLFVGEQFGPKPPPEQMRSTTAFSAFVVPTPYSGGSTPWRIWTYQSLPTQPSLDLASVRQVRVLDASLYGEVWGFGTLRFTRDGQILERYPNVEHVFESGRALSS